MLASCVRSKSFQLSTKDGIPTQLLLIYSSQDRFQVTIAVWVYVVWNNRNHWKFSVNKKSRPSTYHIQTNVSQCAECAFNRKQEFLGFLPRLISSHHKLLEVHLLSSITENSCTAYLFHLSTEWKKYASYVRWQKCTKSFSIFFFFKWLIADGFLRQHPCSAG